MRFRILDSLESPEAEEFERYVVWWHRHIQPEINKLTDRADRDWDWRRIYWVTRAVARVTRQKPVSFAICIVPKDDPLLLPCALVQLAGRYPALNDHAESAVYLWYMADAPKSVLAGLRPEDQTTTQLALSDIPKMLGTVALDTAVTRSFKDGLRGRVGLHADPKGGTKLFQWYESRGMKNLAADAKLPPGIRRIIVANDGRYFYYTTAGAYFASRSLDQFR